VKILAIKLRSLGDSVIALTGITELIHAYPEAQLDVLFPEPYISLLKGFQGVHKAWPFPTGLFNQLLLARSLRSQKYDLVVNFHASPNSAKIARLTGSKKRAIHFHGLETKNSYSTYPIPNKGTVRPAIERDLDSLRAIGLEIPTGKIPHLPISPSESLEAQTFIQTHAGPGPLLAISLGASRPTKSWPVDRFASAAVEWAQDTGSVVIFIGPGEEGLREEFLKILDEYIGTNPVLRRKILTLDPLPLRKFAAILSQTDVWLGNDSGPKHLAIAVGTPTVTLFGPEHPFEWHPYPTANHPYLFIEPLVCRQSARPGAPPWCHLTECTAYDHQCMKKIGVVDVLKTCKELLHKSTQNRDSNL
jgi:ADP-heptose:LPS heptosyltransferase